MEPGSLWSQRLYWPPSAPHSFGALCVCDCGCGQTHLAFTSVVSVKPHTAEPKGGEERLLASRVPGRTQDEPKSELFPGP